MNQTMYMRRLAAKVKTNFNMFDLLCSEEKSDDRLNWTSYLVEAVLKQSVKNVVQDFWALQ